MPSVTKWLHIEKLCGGFFSLPLGASFSALAAAGLQNGAIVSPSAGELHSQKNGAPQRAFHSLNGKLTWGKGNGHTMAAFSGHTEDGDELFGRRFSVAYSHVGTR